jgi:hypothetical protein
MLFIETNVVYCENHTEPTDTLCEQNTEFCNIYKSSPYLTGNTYVSTTKPSRLMLFRETTSVYCGTHKYTVWAECKFCDAKAGGMHSNHWDLRG